MVVFEERYLGDGVYATYDGYSVWLDLRGQDDTTKICLEPQVFQALQQYRHDVRKVRKEANDANTGNAEPSADNT